jgi:proline dehydrogenase
MVWAAALPFHLFPVADDMSTAMNSEEIYVRTALQRLALDESAKRYVMGNPNLYRVLLAASRPFIGGEVRDEALACARQLNRAGHKVTIDYVGESSREHSVVDEAAAEFLSLADDLLKTDLYANISLDLSHIGLVIDPTLAVHHLCNIAGRLEDSGREVIVSAESFVRVDAVLSATKASLGKQRNIGVTVQAYLPRTRRDVQSLLSDSPALVRIVKGSFDPPLGAYERGEALNGAYLSLVKIVADSGTPVLLATHDPRIIQEVQAEIAGDRLDPKLIRFEFLLGIAEDRLQTARMQGRSTQVYITYGKEWFLYLCNRLAEHPPNLIPALGRALKAITDHQ